MSSGKSICPILRKFAMTLHFYSPSAYAYVRTVFNKALPDVSTIRKWYSKVDGLPGMTKESFQAISLKVKELRENGKQLYGCLIMDEMSIKQHVHWTGTRHQGYIDFGLGGKIEEEMDNLPYAKDALVILVVGMNTSWKVPIAYYLINGISAEEKANIILNCLRELDTTGIIIKTLTFDGAANNLSMASELGAKLQYSELKPYFLHPSTNDKIHIILDPCHMVKLLRNCLGDWKILYNKKGEIIKWSYFKGLVNLQNESGLHAATKIRNRHIFYFKEKMKVRLAVQTFSTSVANAISFCMNDLKLDNFQGADATIEFCLRVNNIFDILNTRNLLSKSKYTKTISQRTKTEILQYIDESIDYLATIQCIEKLPKCGRRCILNSERRTGFLGLIITLTSLKSLVLELIDTEYLSFILTYKFSQDHLEMLFSAIRAKGGFNNNPTVSQFEAAYKSIIIHSEIKSSSNANCMALDDTTILRVSSSNIKVKDTQPELLDLLCVAGTENLETTDLLYVYQHSNFINDVVAYIAGFVVRKIKKTILCDTCAAEIEIESSESKLLDRKNHGGLIKASSDVIELCKISERTIRHFKAIDKSNVVNKITLEAMKYININKYFTNLSIHILDQEPLNNHVLQLIKIILNIYCKLRLHHINSSTNDIDQKIRNHYTKLILFKHQ